MISMSEVASPRFDAVKKSDACCERIAGHFENLPSQVGCPAAVQVCAWLTGSSPARLLCMTLGRRVKAGTNQALPPVRNKQLRTASLETDAKTHAHASVPKQNQADLCLNTTILHTRTNTPVCNSPLWRGLYGSAGGPQL